MTKTPLPTLVAGVACAAAAASLTAAPAGAAPAAAEAPSVLHVGQIGAQDIAPQPKSEPDTVVEPDVQVDPYNSRVAVAVAHDGRFPDGGAVGITATWTHDGGRTWSHAPVPGLTTARGGSYPRGSDPVLAWGPDGSVYLSVLLVDTNGCDSAVAVLRSINGGRSWGKPVLADQRSVCTFSDDKNWITVDRNPTSRYYDRVYQFWTPFLSKTDGTSIGNPQVVRWSDDHARTWSAVHYLRPPSTSSQDSQPLIRRDGSIVDVYQQYPPGGGGEGPEAGGGQPAGRPDATHRGGHRTTTPATPRSPAASPLVAQTSTDGGATWSRPVIVAAALGDGAPGVRCCLASATIDPSTGDLYATWFATTPGGAVLLAHSTDGTHWGAPTPVSREPSPTQHVNADVAASDGRVYVSYGARGAAGGGRYVQQKLAVSTDRGAHFATALNLGPRSDLRYAAFSRGPFPGDYTGSSATDHRLYLAWCVSYHVPGQLGPYHQVLWGATLRI